MSKSTKANVDTTVTSIDPATMNKLSMLLNSYSFYTADISGGENCSYPKNGLQNYKATWAKVFNFIEEQGSVVIKGYSYTAHYSTRNNPFINRVLDVEFGDADFDTSELDAKAQEASDAKALYREQQRQAKDSADSNSAPF